MANNTQNLILEAFERMLVRMPFDKITVTALIKESNIGRSTFYYQYADIYALLDDWLIEKMKKLEEKSGSESWEGMLRSVLGFCQENKILVVHINNSISRDRLEYYAFERTESMISDYVHRIGEEKNADPERTQIVAEIFRYAAFGYFLRFLCGGMKDDAEKEISKLSAVYREMLEKMLD